ncbi:rod shape-determining protein MreD [Polymorphobacter sp.]|uniref:rod shape-determining protein MreD n=1 Tax=Polymorphobacter sp. TaxID=1909290 RepID=UPI003F71BC40
MDAAERRRWWLSHWRLAVPALTTLFLLWVMTAPLPLPLPLFPELGVLAIFVWATFQPRLMPPWVAFVLGLVADMLFAQPLGVNATLFALTAGFVRAFERRYGHHAHGFDWAMAVAVVAGFELGSWLLMDLAGRPMALAPLVWQWLTSLLAYPAVAAFCGHAQRRALGMASPANVFP